MKHEWLEKDQVVMNPGDSASCLFLVASGSINLTIRLDNQTDLVIEELVQGMFLNPYNFLVREKV